MIAYISMIIGLAIVMYMMIKGWNPLIVGIVASTAIIVLNGLPYGKTMTSTYFGGFTTMVQSLFPAIFSGSLLAQVYSRSGAVVTIADKLSNLMFKETTSPQRRYVSAILSMVAVSGIVCYCGMNSLVTLIAMYPIALRILERAQIPKRFIMGILSCGVYTFAMSAPGSAEIVNILGMQAMGTTSYAGLYGGIVAVITEIVVTTVCTTAMIKHAVAKGETFAYGPKDLITEDAKEKPGLLISLIPLAVLCILFNVFACAIFTATIISVALAVILFWKNLGGIDELKNIIKDGGVMAFNPVAAVGSIVGFTSVIQALPEFKIMLDSVFSLNISAVFILLFTVSLIAMLTGSSSSAVRIALPLVSEQCQAAGLSAAFIHRVSCFACSIFDTMPWASAIVINLGIADLDMKDGYPPMFISTTFATFCGTMACAAFMYVFPNLP